MRAGEGRVRLVELPPRASGFIDKLDNNSLALGQAKFKVVKIPSISGGFIGKMDESPQALVHSKLMEVGNRVSAWLNNQPILVAVAAMAAIDLTTTAVVDMLLPLERRSLKIGARAENFSGSSLVEARDVAILSVVGNGIHCLMNRWRGKDHVQHSLVAGFCSGTLYSYIREMSEPRPCHPVVYGIAFALVNGAFFQLRQKFSQLYGDKNSYSAEDVDYEKAKTLLSNLGLQKYEEKFKKVFSEHSNSAEDVDYEKARTLLSNLGLQKYEENFKKGELTDNTLLLLNEHALEQVKIPPGPILVILDHIKRDPELKEMRSAHRYKSPAA